MLGYCHPQAVDDSVKAIASSESVRVLTDTLTGAWSESMRIPVAAGCVRLGPDTIGVPTLDSFTMELLPTPS